MLNWRAAAHHERRRRRQAEALVEILKAVLRDQGRPADWRWGAGWEKEPARTEES